MEKTDIPVFFFDQYTPPDPKDKLIKFENAGYRIDFITVGDKMVSVPHAPWGSVLVSGPVIADDLPDFIHTIVAFAAKRGIRKLVIKHPPGFYSHSLPHDRLLGCGFRIQTEEINQHIDLTASPSLHLMEKRKLTSLLKTHVVKKASALKACFRLIEEWRQAQGIPLNISPDHLDQLDASLPDRYDSWEVHITGQPVAACICLRVTRQIVYYFLPATHPAHRSDSPMVILLHHLCEFYRREGYRVLDLGQSSIDGLKQTGLYLFKERMGARSCPKYTLNLTP